MKVLNRPGSAQVIDTRGRLIRAFPDQQQADAFLQGYAAGVKDAGAAVRMVLTETLAAMDGDLR